MNSGFTCHARRLGLCCSIATAAILLAYGTTLVVGLATLRSPDQPIGDPLFAILELLILALTPAMVGLMVALHARAPARHKAPSLVAVVFTGLLAVVTCSVHFTILTVSRDGALEGQPWAPLLLSFTWPSVPYALDILAWDVFFPLSMFFAAPALFASRLERGIRASMIAAGVLALAGLTGVVFGDMRLRNIGIVGYVGVFWVVAALSAVLFLRTDPRGDPTAPARAGGATPR